MLPRDLMRAAMRRQVTPRIPVMPQIWYDLPLRVYAASEGAPDWIALLQRCLEQPALIYDYVIRLVRDIGCDGLRLFALPDPLRMVRAGDDLLAFDTRTGERAGRVDVLGGQGFVPERPVAPIETPGEARVRLEQMVVDLTAEKLDLLRQARARVPDLFVVSAPGGITINTYMTLRGSEQALIDLAERPAFVTAVLDLQVEAMIRRAEALLTTGIDGLYIGDAAASASVISPRYFEKYCLPAYRKFCRHFATRDTLIYIHVCGNSRPLLEMLADTGVHAVEPLDPLGGVSVADARRRIGDRVALMGGVNTLTLAQGTPEETRGEAVQKCREGGPHGYILAAGDMVPPVTPLANLQAMIDVATQEQWR